MSKLTIDSNISIPLREIDFQFSRSGGAGGQHVNKVETRVTLRWKPAESKAIPPDVLERLLQRAGKRVNSDGVLQLSSQRYRDQGRNVADCLDRLRSMVAEAAVAPRKRKKTKPTRAAVEKRLRDKKRRSEQKQQRRYTDDE